MCSSDLARDRETLRLRRVDHGVQFNGFLANDRAELLQTQIDKLSKPQRTEDGDLDPRSRDKRQADALTAILERAAGSTASGPGVPHITVTIDFDDLKTDTADAYSGRGDGGAYGGRGDGGDGGLFERSCAVGELVFGENLSASAVRLLACDARVLPIVLGSDSRPLDVGTSKRFVTDAIRSALIKRDKGCVICKAPPWQCHAHHLTHWADGGPTSLGNLILACSPHHTAIHDGQWIVTITHGAVKVTRPSWADPVHRTLADLADLTAAANANDANDGNEGNEGNDQTNLRDATSDSGLAHSARATGTINVDPSHEQPTRLPATRSLEGGTAPPVPATALAPDDIRSWLTPEATARLDPWGDSGTPSSGP